MFLPVDSDWRLPCELIIASFSSGELLMFLNICGLLVTISAELQMRFRCRRFWGVFGEVAGRLKSGTVGLTGLFSLLTINVDSVGFLATGLLNTIGS